MAFIDLRRAFPSVNREILDQKMIRFKFPKVLRRLILNAFNGLKMHIVSGNEMAKPVLTSVGVPEGNCLSPILFALFTADIENYLSHKAPSLGGRERKSIFFADDGALIAVSADELQKGLNDFAEYCSKNNLTINAAKTKIMIFGRGRIPNAEFFIMESKIEVVKEFKYLGVTLTPQLSYAKHIQACVVKAKARIAYLYLKLPLFEMPLEIVIDIFTTYLLPIFTYCSPIWASSIVSQNSLQQLNSVFTNYVKRYLGLPKYANNAAVHYYCSTWPLYNAIMHSNTKQWFRISFPEGTLNNYNLSFANVAPLPQYVPEIEMNPDFPRGKVHVSRNRHYRQKVFRELFDIDHYMMCSVEKFHTHITSKCKCISCHKKCNRGHKCTGV